MRTRRDILYALYWATREFYAIQESGEAPAFDSLPWYQLKLEDSVEGVDVDRAEFMRTIGDAIRGDAESPSSKNTYENLAFPLKNPGSRSDVITYKLASFPKPVLEYLGVAGEKAFLEGLLNEDKIDNDTARIQLELNREPDPEEQQALPPFLTDRQFYIFYPSVNEANRDEYLVRSVLTMLPEGQIEVQTQNLHRLELDTYGGKWKLVDRGRKLALQIRRHFDPELDFRCVFHLGQKRDGPLFLGQYSFAGAESSVGISGNATLLAAEAMYVEGKDCHAALFPMAQEPPLSEVPTAIWRLFGGLSSFSEMPHPHLHSLDSLESWLDKHAKNLALSRGYWTPRFDVFMSGPVKGLRELAEGEKESPVDHHGSKGIMYLVREKVVELFCGSDEARVRYVGPDSKVYAQDITDAFELTLQQLRNSRFMVFIYPESGQTSALVELSMAVAWGMPGVVFCHRMAQLPYLLSEPAPNFRLRRYSDPQEVIDYLVVNRENILRRMGKEPLEGDEGAGA